MEGKTRVTPKQVAVLIATALLLNIPAGILLFGPMRISFDQANIVGLANLLIGVPLLYLIFEKRIRKMK